MQTHDLVDVCEAVRMTGLDKRTIYRLAAAGTLRSFKVLGRAIRFERGDLLALVRLNPAAGGSLRVWPQD